MNKKTDPVDIDFEIAFYESILKKTPQFIEALAALGDLYTKKGFYEKGLDIDEKLSKLRPHDPLVFYNLACSYSLLKNIDKAFKNIKRAVDLGYNDLSYLEKDLDLDNLRKDGRFMEFLLKIKNKTSDKS